jgi:nucleotide-binding universal stress UspA family protein
MADTILVSIDFQEASLAALAFARLLGERLGLKLVLLHVFHQPPPAYAALDPSMLQGLPAKFIEAAKKGLQDLVSDRDAAYVFRDGEPSSEILDAVRDLQPAYVVMGTHGRRRLSRFLLGSVAERVIRESPVPVITLHAPPQAPAK